VFFLSEQHSKFISNIKKTKEKEAKANKANKAKQKKKAFEGILYGSDEDEDEDQDEDSADKQLAKGKQRPKKKGKEGVWIMNESNNQSKSMIPWIYLILEE
jgi:hypothetical protein